MAIQPDTGAARLKRLKKGTVAIKNHRYESFNRRISKVRVDPIRKSARSVVDTNDASITTSHFRSGLEYWRDVNLSLGFGAFAREVTPFCDNLPQILLYQDRLLETVVRYVEKQDALSMEPLLNLLQHLAHDLGVHFERYFPRVLTVITAVASQHQEVEVIEWCFSSIAWLFKFFSRLLVPNIVPTYDVLAPLLGRQTGKQYLTRFTAEALSSLIRKAALLYPRDRQPLTTIIKHVFNEADGVSIAQSSELYCFGVMNMLMEAMQGVDQGFHSCAPSLLQCLLACAKCATDTSIIVGVLNASVHHGNAQSFGPLLDSILGFVNDVESERPGNISVRLQILFHVSTAHKGSRIADWRPFVSTLPNVLKCIQPSERMDATEGMRLFVRTAVAVFASAPVGTITPHLKLIMEALMLEPVQGHFLAFCTSLGDLNRGRLEELIHPYFYRYLTMYWESQEDLLLFVLSTVASPKEGTANSSIRSKQCPKAWQSRIVETVENLHSTSVPLQRQASYLDLIHILRFDEDAVARIAHSLDSRLSSLAKRDRQDATDLTSEEAFLLGPTLEALLALTPGDRGMPLWDWLLLFLQQFPSWPPLLQNAVRYMSGNPSGNRLPTSNSLTESLISNLSSPSRELRKLSLKILEYFYRQTPTSCAMLTLALSIEELPRDVQSARQGSMLIRRLAEHYETVSSDPLMAKAVPCFCLGLLTLNFAPWWDEAIEVLKATRKNPIADAMIVDVIFDWLNASPKKETSAAKKTMESKRPHLNNFESADALVVEDVVQKRLAEVQDLGMVLEASFDTQLRSRPIDWHNARPQALKALGGLPRLAEKKSRRLVPYILQWADHQSEDELSEEHRTMIDSSISDREDTNTQAHPWSRQEGMALLNLFGQFLNPRTLFRSSDVFEALLKCLSRGDVEVQKSAFKAIEAWKIDAIEKYRTNLLNIIDEARFRDELTTFLYANEGTNVLQPEHFEEVMPVLLRVLFGKALNRRGAAGKGSSPSARRKAIFDALFQLPDDCLGTLLELALEPLKTIPLSGPEAWQDDPLARPKLHAHASLGVVHFLKDFITAMGDRLAFVGERIFSAALYCSVDAEKALCPASTGTVVQASLMKDVRQTGIQSITLAFEHFQVISFEHFIPVLSRELIGPKLGALPTEAAHSVSALLRLFAVWASSAHTAALLASCDPSLIAAVVGILNVRSAKDEVRLFVIEQILHPITDAANADTEADALLAQEIRNRVLHPNMSKILQSAGLLLSQDPSVAVLSATLELVTRLAKLDDGFQSALDLLEVAASLLQQPSRRVSPRAKGYVLDIVHQVLPRASIKPEDELFRRLFESITSLFGYFNDRDNRIRVSKIMHVMVCTDRKLSTIAQLCLDMNAFSTEVIDEPDFDRRIQAFNSAAEVLPVCPQEQCRPLLYNCLFFTKHDDTALRASASFALHKFIASAATSSTGSAPDSELICTVLLSEIRSGASHSSELVRAEYISMMSHLVKAFPRWWEVEDMHPLLMHGDEEASIFNNILHIQQHRRLRAMRRLAAEADKNGLSARNVTTFWIPLLEAFVLRKVEGSAEYNLATESIATIAVLARALEWPQLKAMLRRYSGFVQSRRDIENPS